MMTELNKNSFFFYFMNKTGGRHDPVLLTKMIEALKEWLPNEHYYIVEERDLGWNDAIKTIKRKLK